MNSEKLCYYSKHRCFFPSCTSLDMHGFVVFCRYYRGDPSGINRRRKVRFVSGGDV